MAHCPKEADQRPGQWRARSRAMFWRIEFIAIAFGSVSGVETS